MILQTKTTYSRKNFLLLYSGWWLFWSFIQAFVLHRLGLNWSLSILDSLTSNALLGVLSLCSILIYQYYQPGKENRALRLVFAVGVTWLYIVILTYLLNWLVPNENNYLLMVEKTNPLRFVSGFMFIAFFTILNWLWNSLQEQNEMLARRNETERLAREAELVKLRQQLQPHFLFNSLNSISALISSAPEEARKMIQQLSDFLRGTLKKDEDKTTALKEELRQLELYLSIEKVRFGDRLEIELLADEALNNTQLPPLILQPIVENAIKYGLYGTLGNVKIYIKAQMEGNMLVIDVRNPYDADTSVASQGTGFGLSFVERRLFLLYGRLDLLKTFSNNGIFVSTLRIPQ